MLPEELLEEELELLDELELDEELLDEELELDELLELDEEELLEDELLEPGSAWLQSRT